MAGSAQPPRQAGGPKEKMERICRQRLSSKRKQLSNQESFSAWLQAAPVLSPLGRGNFTVSSMPSMLRTTYLLFNEGYAASGGEQLVRAEFCEEAIRLCRILLSQAQTSTPEVHALCALMLFQHARREARVSGDGIAIPLEAQDRNAWDRAMIAEGFRQMSLAMAGDRLTAYHLEAGIASVHAAAPHFGATDWAQLGRYYDALLEVAPSPVVEINRAIAVAMHQGPDAGLRLLEPLRAQTIVQTYLPFHLAVGELELRRGQRDLARTAFTAALGLAMSEQERKLIAGKLQQAADA